MNTGANTTTSRASSGSDGGKISKLTIRRLSDGKELYNYDRGLDFDILDENGKAAYLIILKQYN